MTSRSFYITTLGCKVNQYESDGIAAELSADGWSRSDSSVGVDICIINTCAVTSRAAMQSRQEIRSIIRSNPDARIIVTGCHAQTAPDEIRKIEQVDFITGHRDKFHIARAIMESEEKPNSTPSLKSLKRKLPYPEDTDCKETLFHSFSPSVTGENTRAYLKIQDGCNAFCSYCIVPHARGRSRSMPQQEVLTHLTHLTSLGYREAILTGIHVGAYGLDFKEKSSLTQLLQQVQRRAPIHRVRLSSIEPRELTEEIIALAEQNPTGNISDSREGESTKLCDHFHIPLQSGDDQILRRMKRPYDSALFETLVNKIHTRLPSAAIGVDVLVGFPGESDDAFRNSYDLIQKLPVSYLHVFPFSPRKGTPAFGFPDKVNTKVVKERCAELRALGTVKRNAFEKGQMGHPLEAVIQNKRDKATGRLIAVTSNYLSVLVDGEDGLLGSIVDIVPEAKEDGRLIGNIRTEGGFSVFPPNSVDTGKDWGIDTMKHCEH